MANAALANGATAAFLKYKSSEPKLWQKQRGRWIDTVRHVCEGHPNDYKNIRFIRCDSCGCTKNKEQMLEQR